MRKANFSSVAPSKQARAKASYSNSPNGNLSDQPNKDTKENRQHFRIISLHIGFPNNISANSSMKGESIYE